MCDNYARERSVLPDVRAGLPGARPGQPDRRAHRLQRGLRPADGGRPGVRGSRQAALGFDRERRRRAVRCRARGDPGPPRPAAGGHRRQRLLDDPVGAGLSSSAALEVALALALCDAAGFELPPLELALACRDAEELATGVPCGIMDQLTSVAGCSGHALLIDCRSLGIQPVPIPDDLAVLVVDSGVRAARRQRVRRPSRRVRGDRAAARAPGAPRRDAGAGRRRAARTPRRLGERPGAGGRRGARGR